MNLIEVNKKLADNYGLFFDGKPNYRVVWSTDETEKRFGTVRVFAGSIFIREETGVHEMPKYPFSKDRFVLEKRILLFNPELTEKIGYEPLFVFQDKHGNPLPLAWRPLEYILYFAINGTPKTLSEHADEDKAKFDAEVNEFMLQIEDNSPTLAGALHDGQAVVVK
jgi:hypothetical protein